MPGPRSGDGVAGYHRAFAVALRFLTRIPLRSPATEDADVGRSLAFFPVVGLLLGLSVAGAAWLLMPRLSAPIIGVVVVALLAALTGGLHLDGVADVFDGLSGSHGDRSRALEIMRDSRIGAHGTVALVLVLVAKVLAVAQIIQRHELRWLVLFPAVARWSVLPLLVYFPYLREVGLGRTFHDQASTREIGWATACIATSMLWTRGDGMAAVAVALTVSVLFGLWMQRRLGGMTGDVFGAAIECAEVAFLVVVSART